MNKRGLLTDVDPGDGLRDGNGIIRSGEHGFGTPNPRDSFWIKNLGLFTGF